MDFYFNESQQALQKEVEAFAREAALNPLRIIEEEQSVFCWDVLHELGRRGWTGVIVPEKYGGMGKGAIEYSIIMEETAAEMIYGPQNLVQAQQGLLAMGTDRQKEKYLPALASGEMLAAQAISEPDAGSSFENIQTIAEKSGDSYIVNGLKVHINLGEEAGMLMVLVKTANGLTELIVDKNTPGISYKKQDPIGLRSAPMYDIIFENCRVPAENLLGRDGRGIETFLAIFKLSRLGVASQLIGVAKGCLARAVEFTKSRKVGKNRVSDFQGIQWIIAKLTAELEAAKLARNKAAWLHDQRRKHDLETSIAKYLAGVVADETVNKAFTMTGSHACYRDKPYDRYVREVKSLLAGGGSSEVMLNNISREVLRPSYRF
ncbi:acyl-CoA dehydrogenase family protein [Leptonema illini]|uniref:Acyl-CoA dehydrogenase domain-containing protein n=1 Tax=Leptonema illini DSM 21528 TaxID=929563 RepID=H2CFT6_9LEPT|nr:acyl-CoA dehydrogenase family protein [Leptonema illini]EHQ06785.1 acyl-CoA dehydrogenase domain-containing protein [Leptonema illini DSM 21528]